MKTKYMLLLVLAVFLHTACEKDNYDPPTTEFVGKLSYNGIAQPWNGNTETSSDAEIIQLYQDGFGKYAPINVRVADDGTFKAMLFNGEYKMVMKNIRYPFVFEDWELDANGRPDTLRFNLKGKKEFDIKVKPYFEFNNVTSEVDGTKLSTTFSLKEVVPGANVRAAYVYMHVNVNVNRGTPHNQRVDISDINSPITIKTPISGYRSKYVNNYRDYAYIRIALELDNADEYLWSEVMKVENLPLEFNDITQEYLKNAGPGFTKVPEDNRPGDIISTPTDWIINDAVKVYDGFGGLELRWGRNAIGASKFEAGDMKNGKIYQTIKLPAGTYEFGFGFNGHNETWNGRDNEAFLVAALGNTIPDFASFKSSSLAYADWNGFKANSIAFTLTEESTISLGFLFNIIGATSDRPGVAYYVPSIQLIKTE